MQSTEYHYEKPPWWTTQQLPFLVSTIGLIVPLMPFGLLMVTGKVLNPETAGMFMLLSLGSMIFLLLLSIACVPLRIILMRRWLAKQPALTLDDLNTHYRAWVFFEPHEVENGVFMVRLLSDWPTGESREVRIDKDAADALEVFFDPSRRRFGTTLTVKKE